MEILEVHQSNISRTQFGGDSFIRLKWILPSTFPDLMLLHLSDFFFFLVADNKDSLTITKLCVLP